MTHDLNSISLLYASAVVFYGLANIAFLAEMGLREKVFGSSAMFLALAGLAAHVLSFILKWARFGVFPALNLHDAMGLFAILILIAYFVSRARWELRGLGFFAVSLAFLATLASYAFPDKLPHVTAELSGVTLEVHIGIILLSFGVFAVAFCASIAYLAQDFFLHTKHSVRFARNFPPLNVLDSLINRLVGLGFVLLSIGMALGSVWANRWWGSWWSFEPKQDLALLTWIVYAVYIHARTLSGWKGKRLVVFIVVGFLLVLATFVGASFLPGRHHFA